MKKTFLFGLLALVSISSMSSQAQANPFELVAYNEGASTFLLRVEKSATGVDMVVVYNCPLTKVIEKTADCGILGEALMPLADFVPYVRQVLVTFSTLNPHQDLAPLTAADLKVVRENTNYAEKTAEMDRLKIEIPSIAAMLAKMPNSPAFQQQKLDAEKKLQDLELSLARIAPVENTVKSLSESLLKLITANNPNDGALNFYAASQMKGTLILEVIQQLTANTLLGSLADINKNLVGKKHTIKPTPNGAFVVYINGNEHSSFGPDPTEIKKLGKGVREMVAAGMW